MADPFEVRLQFIHTLKRLTSSQNSINSTVRFLVKHGPKCGNDLWECLIEECEKANLNARINILYLLDTLLLISSNPADVSAVSAAARGPPFDYAAMIKQDLARIVDVVVPPVKEGLLNLLSARQMLTNWRTKRVVDVQLVDGIERTLEERQHTLADALPSKSGFAKFSRNDVLQRIDDDRERHKRLRERIWVLPIPSLASLGPKGAVGPAPAPTHRLASLTFSNPDTPASPLSPASPASAGAKKPPLPPNASGASQAQIQAITEAGPELPLDVEFEQLWASNEADTGEEGLDENDWEAMRKERERCYGPPVWRQSFT